MALEEGYCVLCWRRKRRGEGTSVRSRRGYSFDLKQWRRDHWLNFVLSIVDCIWTQTKRGSYSPTIYILHFLPSFSCFLRLTTDVTMGIRANLQRRSFFGYLFVSLSGLLPPELGAFTESQSGMFRGCLPQQSFMYKTISDHFSFLNVTFSISYPPLRASVQLDLRCSK